MAITLSISTGVIDKGDTKALTISPKDSSGSGFDLTDLVVVFTSPGGATTTYAENAAGSEVEIGAPVSNVYTINHTFGEAGKWTIKVTGTDASGNVEVESGTVNVQ